MTTHPTTLSVSEITSLIATIPDFPIAGIQFKDISPILANPNALTSSINHLMKKVEHLDFDSIIGIDARGFIFASALAYAMNKGFIMARKANKLPGELLSQSYEYEYNKTTLTLQKEQIEPGKKYLIVDDVLATGQTVSSVIAMLEQREAICSGLLMFIELSFLNGAETITTKTKVPREHIYSLITL